MRLWSINLKYLDAKGLVALWREALLAQNVLHGNTVGYTQHPQLDRFKGADSHKLIFLYLKEVYEESKTRGYNFDLSRIKPYYPTLNLMGLKISVTKGQLFYEFNHLQNKLEKRAYTKYVTNFNVIEIEPHSLFLPIDGTVETWEKTKEI